MARSRATLKVLTTLIILGAIGWGTWLRLRPPPEEEETGLIEFAWEPRECSRLTCQIRVTDELDGLVLHVPAEQL